MFSDEEFEKLVSEAISGIDERFLKRISNVAIIIEHDLTPAQREKLKLKGAFLFGLYEGIPQTQRQHYGQVLPDKITIFKNQIERYYADPDGIRQAVHDTVWHEIAHHFGMDERQVRESEGRRKRNNPGR